MAVIIALIFIVVLGLLAMLGSSVIVAAAGAMFFKQGFGDGFHAAWDQPGYLTLFTLITAIIVGITYLFGD